MNAPDVGPLQIEARRTLGSFVTAEYEGTKRGAGKIRVSVAGEPLGDVDTRPATEREQFLAFDTRRWKGQEALLQISVEGGALRCFDFQIAP
jgi:hypothetical protein